MTNGIAGTIFGFSNGLQLFCTHPTLTGPAAVPTKVHILRPKNLGGIVERERGAHFGPAFHSETSRIRVAVDRLGSISVGFNTVDVCVLILWFFQPESWIFWYDSLPLQFLHPFDKQLAQASTFSIQHTWTVTERLKLLCIHDVDFAQILVGLRPEDVTSLWSRRSVVRYSWYKDVWSLAPCPMCCPFNFNVEQGVVSDFHLWPFNLKIHIIHQPPKFPCQTCNIQVNNVRVWQQFSDLQWVSLRTGCPAV